MFKFRFSRRCTLSFVPGNVLFAVTKKKDRRALSKQVVAHYSSLVTVIINHVSTALLSHLVCNAARSSLLKCLLLVNGFLGKSFR